MKAFSNYLLQSMTLLFNRLYVYSYKIKALIQFVIPFGVTVKLELAPFILIRENKLMRFV